MSRGREWAEELAAMAAEEHNRPVPVDEDARVVLRPDERAMGWRADRYLLLKRFLGPRIREAMVKLTESFEQLCATIEGNGRSFDDFAAEVRKLGKNETSQSEEA